MDRLAEERPHREDPDAADELVPEGVVGQTDPAQLPEGEDLVHEPEDHVVDERDLAEDGVRRGQEGTDDARLAEDLVEEQAAPPVDEVAQHPERQGPEVEGHAGRLEVGPRQQARVYGVGHSHPPAGIPRAGLCGQTRARANRLEGL